MRFEVTASWSEPTSGPWPAVMLRENNWDDFGYKTLFGVSIHFDQQNSIDLGDVKIMRDGQTRGATKLPGRRFDYLGSEYCSLGQEAEYYEKLASLPLEVRSTYLRAVRDAAYDQTIRRRFMSMDAWSTSLTRFGQASHALEVGKELVRGRRRAPGRAEFQYVRGGASALTIKFDFDDTGDLPGRSNVIIGYNGVGKTHLLAELARVASGRGSRKDQDGSLVGRDSTFNSVIAISYSAFDSFEIPQDKTRGQADELVAEHEGNTAVLGYVYCGLRRLKSTADQADPADEVLSARRELKSLDEIDRELLNALEVARHRRANDRPILRDALMLLQQEPSFGRIGVHPSEWLDIGVRPAEHIARLSTGHKIVLNIVTQLAAHLKPRSIVLLDEPETHLHPPLLAAMLKVVQRLLDTFDSFVIIATHSPVVLQEVPARAVRVLTRFGDLSEVDEPEIETFGENVGTITRHVFSLDSTATDYQSVLGALAERLTLDEIERLFKDGLSDQARALVLRGKRRSL